MISGGNGGVLEEIGFDEMGRRMVVEMDRKMSLMVK